MNNDTGATDAPADANQQMPDEEVVRVGSEEEFGTVSGLCPPLSGLNTDQTKRKATPTPTPTPMPATKWLISAGGSPQRKRSEDVDVFNTVSKLRPLVCVQR
jgi:hypothetical protein